MDRMLVLMRACIECSLYTRIEELPVQGSPCVQEDIGNSSKPSPRSDSPGKSFKVDKTPGAHFPGL